MSRARRGAANTGERVLEGLGVAHGVAIGPAFVVESGRPRVRRIRIKAAAVEAECERLAAAVASSANQIRQLQQKTARLSSAAAEEIGYLLDASVQMLSGSLIRGVAERIRADRVNAESAVEAEIRRIGDEFAQVPDAYLAGRIHDINDVGVRLIRNLTNTTVAEAGYEDLPKGSLIVAERITPADTALMDPARVGGFAAAVGGPESHTAIMARSLGLPAVLGIADIDTVVATGDVIIVDGTEGKVILRPEPATLALYDERRAAMQRERRTLSRLRDLPAVTLDGTPVLLQANVELAGDAELAVRAGASGIGLLRTEFLYMNRPDLPSEDEQYAAVRAFIEGMDGRPTTVRTLDVGGDKIAASLGQEIESSPNPAMGLRAIRLQLKIPALLETQLSAILRAAAFGPVRILVPMISAASQMDRVRGVMHRVARKLTAARVRIPDPLPPLGAMIEIPAAALGSRAIADAADFLSLGTNDLTMYTLAIDRGDEQVADLYDPLHPAVLRLIRFAIEGAERAGKPIGLCGEMAGDPRFTELLVGLGLRDLSMHATNLPRIKRRVREIDLSEATRRAHLVLDQPDSARISALLDSFGD